MICDLSLGEVDHKNRNPLDNRRCNLRPATKSNNQRNVVSKRSGKFKGVFKFALKHKIKWRARICHNGKQISLGLFDSQELAAQAYDSKAKEWHGEFARLNFPPTNFL